MCSCSALVNLFIYKPCSSEQALLKTIATAERKATAAIEKLLWVTAPLNEAPCLATSLSSHVAKETRALAQVPANSSRLGHYRAMQNSKGDAPDALMSDSLHANMWSMILGFGPIVPLC